MVKLFNILISKDNISCDNTPEDCTEAGHVTMNIKSQEIIDVKYSEYEYGKKLYVAHVRKKLAELTQLSEIPKEVIAIWY